jgi:DNA-binding MarR family transcriptional regulator
MKKVFYTDEEQAILAELSSYPAAQQTQILKDSIAAAENESDRNALKALLLKVKAPQAK